MRLYTKSMLIICAVFAAALIVVYALSGRIILGSFVELERKDAEANVQRAVNAFEREIGFLHSNNIDWSAWDDAYEFARDRNPAFLSTNMIDKTFVKLELNLIVILDSNGQVLYERAYDFRNNAPMAVPEAALRDLFARHPDIAHITSATASYSGFIMAGKTPMLLSARPIVKSNYEGPVRGTFITARYVDPAGLAGLSKKANLDLSFGATGGAAAGDSPSVKYLDDKTLRASAVLDDIFGEPALVLDVNLKRGIYQEGLNTVRYFMLALLAITVVSVVLMWWLLKLNVFVRLAKVSGDLQAIRASGSHAARIELHGGDEIGELSASINDTLAALETALRERLEQREILVREVHHRTKNSLAVIQSLLRLQSSQVSDATAKELLVESQSRVRAMGMIHEMLYNSTDLATINIEAYLKGLVTQLFHTYNADASRIKLRLDVQKAQVDVSTVIPCGLIVNELVSNALKYAFPHVRPGELYVGFGLIEGDYMLVVRDNGVGMPEAVDINDTKTLGMQIVMTLSKQIRGDVKLNRSNGTEFRIRISRTEPAE